MSRAGVTVVAVASVGVIVVAAASPPPLAGIQGPAIELSASAGPLVDAPNGLAAVFGAASADPGTDVAVGPTADVGAVLSGLTGGGPSDISGLSSLDVLSDPGSDPSGLTSLLITLAEITIFLGIGPTALLVATPFSLLSVAVTSLGAAIASLGGVFIPVGTAVAALAALPAGIAELVGAASAAITQGLVTAIYDFLIKLIPAAASPLSVDAVVGPLDGLSTVPGSGFETPPADLSTLLSVDPADLIALPSLDSADLTASLDPSAALDFSQLVPDLLAVF